MIGPFRYRDAIYYLRHWWESAPTNTDAVPTRDALLWARAACGELTVRNAARALFRDEDASLGDEATIAERLATGLEAGRLVLDRRPEVAIPLALRVSNGLEPNYDNPYGLMAIMGVNIQLHLVAGVALVVAYVAVLVVQAVAPGVPLFLR